MSGWTVRPIGWVRSAIRHRKGMPPLGAPAAVELAPEFADGLLRLEKHSHLWVLAWLDGAERDLLQVTPRGVEDRGPGGLHGVFAVRSPARPNPIGLTAARVLRVEGCRVDLDRLDFIDGTPVVDLKPYFPARDVIFSATSRQVGRIQTREALRESLLYQAERFLGSTQGEVLLAVRIVEHFRAEVLGMVDPPSWKLSVPADRPVLADALMALTRATRGHGTLLFHPAPAVTFAHEGALHTYYLRDEPVGFRYSRQPADALLPGSQNPPTD